MSTDPRHFRRTPRAVTVAAIQMACDWDIEGNIARAEQLVRQAPDRALSRINALDFARDEKLDEERVIAGFLHAARTGLFELRWDLMCPNCRIAKGVDSDRFIRLFLDRLCPATSRRGASS